MKPDKLLLLILLFASGLKAQEFEFPENRMGMLADAWFDYVNIGDSTIYEYDTSGEWIDFLHSMRQIVIKNKGVIPLMISYQTNQEIAIYSKEQSGGFVRLIIGLTENDEISQLSIKKVFLPNHSSGCLNLKTQQIHQIVKNIANSLETRYVRDDLGARYSAFLRTELTSGKYGHFKQADLLALRLTRDLQNFSGDKHLELIPPTQINAVRERFGAAFDVDVVFIDVDKAVSDFIFIDTDKPEDATIELALAPDPKLSLDVAPEDVSLSPIKSKMLENSIGLVTLERFVGNEEGLQKIRSAFEVLKSAESLVIDLRQSGGGDGDAANEILSYLLSQNSVFVDTFNSKELFVLTSSGTISAGESVAYRIKKSKRGIIVGEQTAGAGYRVDVFDVGYGFYFVNSIASSFDESKGEGWQGTGVQPDVEIEPSKTLEYVINRIRNSKQ